MPGTVKTSLNYYPMAGCNEMHLGSVQMFRRTFDPREVVVEDIRGREADFSLDTHGFMLHPHISQHVSGADTSTVVHEMYPETAAMLKEIAGATRVHVFSHLIRSASFEEMQRMAATSTPGTSYAGNVAPARAVHIDQSETGAYDILHDNMSEDEVERLQKSRWAIINVWRPLEPIKRDPLGLCDARSASEEDLVDVPTHLPSKSTGDKYTELSKGRSFGSFRVRYSDAHKWYYASEMTTEEVLLIKIFDSDKSGHRARRTPHSSFADPAAVHDSSPRKSLEIRCLVFFENEDA
ncbi:hypothetical protein BO71DRAFT_225628 [Aspergillus ellipticus CBS 707.79]|uniref:GA4 desaturase family protein n=1 Tax=Aspergillus ellipticus CBS 707.79 TaxID=1448320 RepID=A0A319DB89_9EURO|nr:hypothetical protein BO71DRAFT_225628 [Aspergillus ellipticus CBS 707.79]